MIMLVDIVQLLLTGPHLFYLFFNRNIDVYIYSLLIFTVVQSYNSPG